MLISLSALGVCPESPIWPEILNSHFRLSSAAELNCTLPSSACFTVASVSWVDSSDFAFNALGPCKASSFCLMSLNSCSLLILSLSYYYFCFLLFIVFVFKFERTF